MPRASTGSASPCAAAAGTRISPADPTPAPHTRGAFRCARAAEGKRHETVAEVALAWILLARIILAAVALARCDRRALAARAASVARRCDRGCGDPHLR